MRRLLVASALVLAACGARTELDPFSQDAGPTADARTPPDVPSVAPGLTIGLFSGNTANDGTSWLRPFSCGAPGGGPSHFYSVETFENPTAENLRVEVLVDWTFDGFLHVYESPFNPTTPAVRCLNANDDFGSTRRSQIEGIVVPAGGAIDLVLSSFSAGTTGDYDAFVITQ